MFLNLDQLEAKPTGCAAVFERFYRRVKLAIFDLFVDLRVGEPDHAFRDRTVSAIEKMWD